MNEEQNEIIEDVVEEKFGELAEASAISKHQFYFETALYEPIRCLDPDSELFSGDVHAYNSIDGFDTTYRIAEDGVDRYGWEGFRKIKLTCKRGGKTILRFFIVHFTDGSLMKIGQYPSLADIQFAEISEKYDDYLSKNDLKNYKKAIGLYTHGAGAGSFVYLRRIFENLIFETYENHKKDVGTEESDFKVKRMGEKIELLKDYLPSQLLEMKSVYKILSKGVHELDEEDCLDYFSSIKLSITLILDQKIETKVKEMRDELVKKELQDIQQKVKSKDQKTEVSDI